MTVTDPDAAAAAPRAGLLHALVRTRGHTIAIPGEYVARALEAPAELANVPRRAGAIEGLMTIGSGVLPVISLARWLAPAAGFEPQPAPGAERADADADANPDANPDAPDTATAGPARGRVLLLRDADACIGLAVDAVIGTQRLRPDQVHRLFHDDDPQELFQSAALFGADTVATSILDPRRLMALAGVWVKDADLDGRVGADVNGDGATGRAPADASAQDARRAPGANTVAHATFRIGDARVALPAACIGELMREPPLRRELPRHDGILGLCEWRGRLVPVVDLTAALDALPAGDDARWVCIVQDATHAIGIVVHEVLEIARIAADAGVPDPAPQAGRAVVGRRLVAREHTLQVIDLTALLRRYAETAISVISAIGARRTPADRRRTAIDADAPAYMVFEAGGLFAARIDGVQEVVAVPADLRAHLDAGVAATLRWRRQAVPVVAVADALVRLDARNARQLVVVRQGDRLAALPIISVKALVPRGVASRTRLRLQGRSVEVISVETEDHRASYPVVELLVAPEEALA